MLSRTVLAKLGFYVAVSAVSVLLVVPLESAVISTGWDKSNHALAFFVLLLLMDYAYPQTRPWPYKVLLLLAYGVLIEVVQNFIPYRFFSLLDVIADGVGLALYLSLRPLLLQCYPLVVSESEQSVVDQ